MDIDVYGYILTEIHVGAMDGCYSGLEDAERIRDHLEDRWKGSKWVVTAVSKDERDRIKGDLPNGMLFHADEPSWGRLAALTDLLKHRDEGSQMSPFAELLEQNKGRTMLLVEEELIDPADIDPTRTH